MPSVYRIMAPKVFAQTLSFLTVRGMSGDGLLLKRFLNGLIELALMKLINWNLVSSSHTGLIQTEHMSRAMWFPTMWHLTSVDSDEPVQPPFRLRNSKWCSISSLTFIEYSSDKKRLWSDCAYAQADLRLCWSHLPHCWKSHVTAHLIY